MGRSSRARELESKSTLDVCHPSSSADAPDRLFNEEVNKRNRKHRIAFSGRAKEKKKEKETRRRGRRKQSERSQEQGYMREREKRFFFWVVV